MTNEYDMSIEDMLDLEDPVMDMVDAVIDELEDTEFEVEACVNESDMILVDVEADKMESVPGFMLGIDDSESEEDDDPYEGIELF